MLAKEQAASSHCRDVHEEGWEKQTCSQGIVNSFQQLSWVTGLLFSYLYSTLYGEMAATICSVISGHYNNKIRQ